jgi:hypothetical protein
VARVVVTATALAELDSLIASRSLPDSTRARVRGLLAQLGVFPLLGRQLVGRWVGFRVVLGPWTWMLLVYAYDEATDVVSIVTIQDSRTATAATSEPQ